MLIEVNTVIAQIINFLILFILLWHFLYRPILQTIKKRQAMIDERWENAEVSQKKAQREGTLYRQKQKELQQQREAIMIQAQQEVEQERQKLLLQARCEVEQMEAKWKDALAQEKDNFLLALRQKILGETNKIVRLALRDLANADLEEQIVTTFCQRLQQTNKLQWQKIAQSLSNYNQPIVISSSFEIPFTSRQKVRETLNLVLQNAGFRPPKGDVSNENLFKFRTLPDLICGVRVNLAGYEISWNLDDYLQILEERLSATFK
ncbi:hypothetical protein BC008_05380 [Mastigocoleus testarum BC008]|uniref:ATP synthase subunit b n=2 Tax=Mastigocoleus TaxID=996924 RepID=A0A0V7ZZ63_9CYAN|nr:hypothetical protein BC008_05380 [Mastigocoleus testarum BC008]